MRIILILTILLQFFHSSSAQGLTGIWKGQFVAGAGTYSAGSTYKYEVQFLDNGGKLEGVTYSYLDTRFYGKAVMTGSYNSKAAQVILRETKMMELKTTAGAGGCRMTCYLHVVKSGNEIFLEGTYTSISDIDSSNCGGGSVVLRKVVFSDFGKEPFLSKIGRNVEGAPDPRDRKPDATANSKSATAKASVQKNKTLGSNKSSSITGNKAATVSKTDAAPAKVSAPVVNQEITQSKVPLPDLERKVFMPTVPIQANGNRILLHKVGVREDVLVATVVVEHPEITLKFYDNGEIDNDSISVYRNNELILSKQRLSAKPIELKINLENSGGTADIIMMAENLGTIPPNTALMIVEAGKLRQEVRLSSDLKKNAKVIFKLK